jgi:hypothetical protein
MPRYSEEMKKYRRICIDSAETPEEKLTWALAFKKEVNLHEHIFTYRASATFSRLCSKLHQLAEAEAYGYEDIRAYGAPSECGRAVRQGTEYRALQALDDYGYTVESFVFELHERISPKAAYNSQLESVLPDNAVMNAHDAWENRPTADNWS